MEKTGVIVIGGNSITFTLSEIQKSGYFKIIDELSSPIRLCEDLIKSNEISSSKIEESISILRNLKVLATSEGAEKLITVSKSFLLNANNKDILLNRIKNELDIDITLLSDKDEIYYDYLTVINSIYLNNAILVDIGENSTNIIWILNKTVKDSLILPIGSVNLSLNYSLQDKPSKEELEKAMTYLNKELSKLHKIKGAKFGNIIGVGETIHTIAKLDMIRKKYPLEILHNYVTNDIDVHDIYNLLKCKNLLQRKRLEGLPLNMADIIVGGALIFQGLISYFDAAKIVISERSLKEGIIFNYIKEKYNPMPDMLTQSLNGIMENLNINKFHSEHVYFITKKLFDLLKPIHQLEDNYDNIIKTASYLHDIGINIAYYNHHINSFYMILNSYINGLTHKELLESAAIAASHRNSSFHPSLTQYSLIINKLSIKEIDEIGILLAISERLDICLKNAVEDLDAIIKENVVIIKIHTKSDLKLEIQQALNVSRRFHEIYDKNLLICKA